MRKVTSPSAPCPWGGQHYEEPCDHLLAVWAEEIADEPPETRGVERLTASL